MNKLQNLTFPLAALAALAGVIVLAGCIHHTVDVKPIKVEPIYMKIDVTIREEVKQDLDDVFDFKDDAKSGDGNGG